METLTFRIMRGQRRELLIGAAFLGFPAVFLSVVGAFRGVALGGWVFAGLTGLLALLLLHAYLMSVIGYTECSPAGVLTRGYSWKHQCRWQDVRGVAVQESITGRGWSRHVVITTVTGRRFRLFAPYDSQGMPDPQFDDKARQIYGYWQATAGTPSHGGRSASLTREAALPHEATLAGDLRPLPMLGGVLLIFAVAALQPTVSSLRPAWAAHLGHGTVGMYTADSRLCATCGWSGIFVSYNGSGGGLLPLADGSGMAPGHTFQAIAVGHPPVVYPLGGGTIWLRYAVFASLEIAVIILVLLLLLRRLRRHRKARRAGIPRAWYG